MSTLERAIAIATRAHAGQTDKAGAPYIDHPLAVMALVDGDVEKIVAVLHDVLEDTTVTEEDLRRAGFGDDVLLPLLGVTRREGESYEAFVGRAGRDPIARAVKIADLKSNLSEARPLPDAVRQKLKAKYEPALSRLLALDADDASSAGARGTQAV